MKSDWLNSLTNKVFRLSTNRTLGYSYVTGATMIFEIPDIHIIIDYLSEQSELLVELQLRSQSLQGSYNIPNALLDLSLEGFHNVQCNGKEAASFLICLGLKHTSTNNMESD